MTTSVRLRQIRSVTTVQVKAYVQKSGLRLVVVEGPSPFSSTEVLGDAFSNTVQLRLFRRRPALGSVLSLRVKRSSVKVSARNEVLNPYAPEFIPRRSPENLKKRDKKEDRNVGRQECHRSTMTIFLDSRRRE